MGLYPPLPCRASPPQGGRSARGATIASRVSFKVGETLPQIDLPLEGEMPGRAEGVSPTRIGPLSMDNLPKANTDAESKTQLPAFGRSLAALCSMSVHPSPLGWRHAFPGSKRPIERAGVLETQQEGYLFNSIALV